MPGTNLYLPHSINFPSGTDLTQLDDLSPEFALEAFRVHSASEVTQGFSGSMSTRPVLSMATTQVKDVLDQMDQDGIAKAFSASNVDLEYRLVNSLTGRAALAATSNIRARLANSLFCLNSISARIGSLATASFTLLPVSADGTTAPMVVSTGVAISATSAVQAVFEVGPVSINGSAICVQGWDYSSNISMIERRCSGSPYLEYAAVERAFHVFDIDVDDIGAVMSHVPAGTNVTSFTAYLRKKSQGGINVADATAQHISITGSVGAIRPINPRRVQVELHAITVSTTTAIS